MVWKRQKLRMVKEHEATGEIKAVYDDIKETLGIPHVSVVFQVLASFPHLFSLFWKKARPMLETGELFSAAGQIRDEAYSSVKSKLPVPDLQSKLDEMDFSPRAQEELKDVVDLYHYVNPVLLLLMAGLKEGFEHPEGAAKHGSSPAQHLVHPARPILVDERLAPEPTRKLYEDIKATMQTPYLNTSYITFGRWPDFLQEYWTALKPLIGTPVYEQQRADLKQRAFSLANELPEAMHISAAEMEKAGVSKEERSALLQTLNLFLEQLSKQVLNIAFAKVGLDGGKESTAAA